MMRKALTILAAAALLAAPLAAQRPQTREGFWISFGFGGGSLGGSCDGCTNIERDNGGTAYLRLGGTTSPKILLGAEIQAWTKSTAGVDVISGVTTFTVYFYPSPAGGLYLKAGVGGATYTEDSGAATAESTTGGAILGVGYDVRVGRNISITPVLTFFGSSKADLTSGGTVVESGFSHNVATLQLGITFH